MALVLCKMRLRMTWNWLRASGWRLAGIIFATLYIGGIVLSTSAGFFFAGQAQEVGYIPVIVTALGLLLALGVLLGPVLFVGSDPTLDPVNYTVFCAPTRRLARGLMAQTFASLGNLALLLIALVPVLWLAQVAPPLATVATALIWLGAIAVAIAASRLLITSITAYVPGKRVTLIRTVFAMIVFAIFVPSGMWLPAAITALFDSSQDWSATSQMAVDIIRWIPLVGAWSVSQDALTGDWLHIVYVAATLALIAGAIAAAWPRVVRRSMTRPTGAGATVQARGDLTATAQKLSAILPTPAAALAAKELRYMRSDSRYFAQYLSIALLVLMGLGFLFMDSFSDVDTPFSVSPLFLLMPLWAIGLAGGMVFYLPSLESTANWMHVRATITGRQIILGRATAVSVPALGFIALALAAVTFGQLYDPFTAAAYLLCAYLAGLGSGALMSAFFAVPMPPPGTSAFNSGGQGQSLTTILLSLISSLLLLVSVGIPALIIYLLPIAYVAEAVALLAALVWFAIAIAVAGKILERNQVRILNTIISWPGHKQRL